MHEAALLSLFQHDLLYVAGEKLKKPYWYTERKLNLSFITQYQHYFIHHSFHSSRHFYFFHGIMKRSLTSPRKKLSHFPDYRSDLFYFIYFSLL